MTKRIVRIVILIFITAVWGQFYAAAQKKDTTLIKLTMLRNEFVNKIKSFKFTIKLSPPEIVLNNPPSFGNYDDSLNRMEMSNWETMDSGQKDFFNSMAHQMNDKETGKDFFEQAIYHWVFIHELGHWWSANKKVSHTHYEAEMNANRIAAAFWREMNPSILDFTAKGAKGVIENMPNPVPADSSKEVYFNANYNNLIGTSVYSWYQAMMIMSVYNESPIPTFKEAIASSK